MVLQLAGFVERLATGRAGPHLALLHLSSSFIDCDQTQLMVEVPTISYFAIPTDGKGVLVWFHFLLSAGLLLTGYC